MRILMVFLDGVGIGSNDPDVNPFMRARIDTLAELMGAASAFSEAVTLSSTRATLAPLDATLGKRDDGLEHLLIHANFAHAKTGGYPGSKTPGAGRRGPGVADPSRRSPP